jgi:predicted Zn-dependent peptidase
MTPALEEEIEKLQNELISEREFQKIQNQMESDFIQSNSTMAGIAESLADYHTYFGDANYINTEIERYRKVTREDIQRVAKQYLVKDNRVVLNYLPKSEEPTAAAE